MTRRSNKTLRRAAAPGDIGDEAKPRPRSRRGPRVLPAERATAQLRALRIRDDVKTTGTFIMADRSRSGSKSGVVYGATGPQGGISVNPAHRIAWAIRKALDPRAVLARRPDCIVTDAAGQPIAVIDGVTRQRRPV